MGLATLRQNNNKRGAHASQQPGLASHGQVSPDRVNSLKPPASPSPAVAAPVGADNGAGDGGGNEDGGGTAFSVGACRNITVQHDKY